LYHKEEGKGTKNFNEVKSMSDIFLLFLIFLMLAYTFWDELFTR